VSCVTIFTFLSKKCYWRKLSIFTVPNVLTDTKKIFFVVKSMSTFIEPYTGTVRINFWNFFCRLNLGNLGPLPLPLSRSVLLCTYFASSASPSLSELPTSWGLPWLTRSSHCCLRDFLFCLVSISWWSTISWYSALHPDVPGPSYSLALEWGIYMTILNSLKRVGIQFSVWSIFIP